MPAKQRVEIRWTDDPIGADEITVGAAAKRLGLARPSVLNAIWTGRLPAVRRANPLAPRGVYYIRLKDVDAFPVRPKVGRNKIKATPKRPPTRNREDGQAS
jgi:hypothetical protein